MPPPLFPSCSTFKKRKKKAVENYPRRHSLYFVTSKREFKTRHLLGSSSSVPPSLLYYLSHRHCARVCFFHIYIYKENEKRRRRKCNDSDNTLTLAFWTIKTSRQPDDDIHKTGREKEPIILLLVQDFVKYVRFFCCPLALLTQTRTFSRFHSAAVFQR